MASSIKIWLDDERPAPCGWLHCWSVDNARQMIQLAEETSRYTGNEIRIEMISLDHDLGCFASSGGDGIKLMDWLVERGTLYPVRFHTMNPVGRQNMERMYRRYWLGQSL